MKLLRCHINNFGVLSNFDKSFTDGLNIILEPNGWGKSTLAAFIMAVLYGFPRQRKGLEDNPRRRYRPWQGGNYGGWLEVEFEEATYRLVREFGETPAKDNLKVYCMRNSMLIESNKLTKVPGEYFFGIDADSFLRSVFMPQVNGPKQLSTDTINAKLTGLIEDTDDVNNYTKIIERISKERSRIDPQRGENGVIPKLNQQIRETKQKLDGLESKKKKLEQSQKREQNLLEEINSLAKQLEDVRHRAEQASNKKVHELVRKEIDERQRRLEQLNTERSNLLKKYPKGIPDSADIHAALDSWGRYSQLVRPQPDRGELQNAWGVLQDGDKFFQSHVPTEEELIAAQNALIVSRQLRKELVELNVSSDQNELKRLLSGFPTNPPSVETIDDCREKLVGLEKSRASLEALQKSMNSMSGAGQSPQKRFLQHVPTQGELETVQRNIDALRRDQETLKNARLMPGQDARYEELRSLFSITPVPSQEEFTYEHNLVQQIDAAKAENLSITTKAVIAAGGTHIGPFGPICIICGIASGLLAIYLATISLTFWPVFVACSVALLFIGVFIIYRGKAANKNDRYGSGLSERDKAAISRNTRNIELGEASVRDFLKRYGKPCDNLSMELQLLESEVEEYHNLNDKYSQIVGARKSLSAEIDERKNRLSQYFAQFDYGQDNYAEMLQSLRVDVAQYRSTSNQIQQAVELEASISRTREELESVLAPYRIELKIAVLDEIKETLVEIKRLSATIQHQKERINETKQELENAGVALCSFLNRYFEHTSLDEADAQIKRLRERSNHYGEAMGLIERFEDEKRERAKQAEAEQQKISDFIHRYGLEDIVEPSYEALKAIDDDISHASLLKEQILEASNNLEHYINDHGEFTGSIGSESDVSLNELKSEERKLLHSQDEAKDSCSRLRQNNELIKQEIDQIPMLEDHLERMKTRLAAARQKVETLDNARQCLEDARNNLSAGYLDRVKTRFETYLHMFISVRDAIDEVQVSPELEVEFVHNGSPKKLAFYSAGIEDLVYLCMRLSLADALFGNDTTLVMLDDPFANLDDNNLSIALNVLRELSAQRQIIYFACHTSRLPNSD